MRCLLMQILLLAFGSPIAFTQQIAPGIPLPSHGDVWVCDGSGSAAHLVRLKYAVVHMNLHRGANVGRALAWPVGGRAVTTIEISGSAAAARLSNGTPVFYVRSILADPEEAAVITEPGAELAILRLIPVKDSRVLEAIAFTELTGTAHPKDERVKLTTERIADTDWLKVVAAQPLAPGEYALTWVGVKPNDAMFPAVVYDFGIEPGTAHPPASH